MRCSFLYITYREKIDSSGKPTFYCNDKKMLFVLYICKHMENVYSYNTHHAFPHGSLQIILQALPLHMCYVQQNGFS